MVSDLKTRLWFGKHRGETVEAVLDADPSWLVWAHHKTEVLRLTPELLKMAQNAAAVNTPASDRWAKSWGFDSPLFDEEAERERDTTFSGLWDK